VVSAEKPLFENGSMEVFGRIFAEIAHVPDVQMIMPEPGRVMTWLS